MEGVQGTETSQGTDGGGHLHYRLGVVDDTVCRLYWVREETL